MNIHPSISQSKYPMLKTISVAVSAFAVAISSASAAVTYDLRVQSGTATGSGITVGGAKSLGLAPGASGSVVLEVWAQITGASPASAANQYGIAQILGSIVTSNAALPGAFGSLGVMSGAPGFTQTVAPGTTGSELSTTPDLIRDLGTNSTTSSTGDPAVAKDLLVGGTQFGTVFFATNTAPANSVNNAIPGNANGWEFLMARTTLTISDYAAGGSTVNWKVPAFTLPANKTKLAIFTQGDGLSVSGSTAGVVLGVGAPIVVAVPEPSAFGMVLVGALSMVGFRRFTLRRQS